MNNIFLIVQIVIALMLVGLIMLQAQGAGFGATWSGGGETYHTRRGMEKVVFALTIMLIILFGVISIINVL